MDRLFLGRLACLIFLVPCSAYSATYYTGTTGSDSNPGTQSSPFLTIGKGISALNSGDVLEVGAGVYVDDPIENVPSGTVGAYTTIRTRAAAQIRFSSYNSGNRAVYLG